MDSDERIGSPPPLHGASTPRTKHNTATATDSASPHSTPLPQRPHLRGTPAPAKTAVVLVPSSPAASTRSSTAFANVPTVSTRSPQPVTSSPQTFSSPSPPLEASSKPQPKQQSALDIKSASPPAVVASPANNTSALRFTCCRCRRSFLVTPGEQRSAAATRSSATHASTSSTISVSVDPSPLRAAAPDLFSAVVESSIKTRGTGQRFRPLSPQASVVDICDTAADTIVKGEAEADQWERRRALLDALAPSCFTTADVFTDKQLTELLSVAQRTCSVSSSAVHNAGGGSDTKKNGLGNNDNSKDSGGVAGADCGEVTMAFASPQSLCDRTFGTAQSSPPPSQLTSSPSGPCWVQAAQEELLKASVTKKELKRRNDSAEAYQLLDVVDLVSLKVHLQEQPSIATLEPSRGNDGKATPTRLNDGLSAQPHLTQSSETSSQDSEATQRRDNSGSRRSSPTLTHVETLAMPPHDNQKDENNDSDVMSPVGSSAARTATPGSTPSRGAHRFSTVEAINAVMGNAAPDAPSTKPSTPSLITDTRHADSKCAESVCPPPKCVYDTACLSMTKLEACDATATVVPAAARGSVDAAPCPALKRTTTTTTAGEGAIEFDERYRRWMRLLVHTASTPALQAQPLCMDCWSSSLVLPLQQRTRNALEGAETLHAALHLASPEDKERMFTLSCAAPEPDMHFITKGKGEGGVEAEFSMRKARAGVETWSSVACLPTTSLDAVAANFFGAQEETWLETISTLAAPHQSVGGSGRSSRALLGVDGGVEKTDRTRRSSQQVKVEDGFTVPSLFPSEFRTPEQPSSRESSDSLAARQAELQCLFEELRAVQQQQAALDTQVGDLRSVLRALNSTDVFPAAPLERAGSTAVAATEEEREENITADRKPQGDSKNTFIPDVTVSGSQSAREAWRCAAVAHNIREVQAAFTTRDEAAERRCIARDLATRHAFVASTSIDSFCFPLDVSGPMGTIAGLRLGLVPPYVGTTTSTTVTAAAAKLHSPPSARGALHGASSTSESQRLTKNGAAGQQAFCSGTAGSENEKTSNGKHEYGCDGFAVEKPSADLGNVCTTAEEALCLEGFVRRQKQYTQLFLSGNTAGNEAETDARHRLSNTTSAALASASAVKDTAAAAAAAENARVSIVEVNAACGYLLLLLNYLAHVNGFAFQSAVLRPAGDRSTVAILKRVSSSSSGGGNGTATAKAEKAAAPTASFNPFTLFGLFTGGGAAATAAPSTTAAQQQQQLRQDQLGVSDIRTRGGQSLDGTGVRLSSSWSSPRATYAVDHEVDFFITDRIFAWRTFGPACVAVATCVRELSDALHESLRCWRMQESLMSRHARAGDAADGAASSPTTSTTPAASSTAAAAAEDVNALPIRRGEDIPSHLNRTNALAGVFGSGSTVPVSLVCLVELLPQDSLLPDSTVTTEAATRPPPPSSPSPPEEAAATTTPELAENLEMPAAMTTSGVSQFPLHPPYRIQGDTVDGFSVRHGSVTDAIWTLGMKKLLADVQWCVEATVELERLYAITGEGDDEGSGLEDE